MNKSNNKYYYSIESKKRIRSLIILICFTLILLITTVYAWITTQRNISINNLKGKIEVAEGLQISLDAEQWSQSISFGTTDTGNLGKQISNGITASWDDFDLGIQTSNSSYLYNGVNYVTNNIRPLLNTSSPSTFTRGSNGNDNTTGYLVPISSSGSLETDGKRLKFFKGTYTGIKLKDITETTETTDTGMYAFDVYLMNTTEGENADQLYLNFDSIVREIKHSVDGEDYGLKNCVRVGLAFYSGVTGSSSSKGEVLENIDSSLISQVAIWEPNYDTHSEYVMMQNEKLRELAQNTSNNALAINSLYIDSIPLDSTIENVYTTDTSVIGLKSYQSIKTKGEIKTAQLNDEDVSANASGIQKIIDINGADVKLTANKISKMRIYIWLEGQDPDCISWASHSDGIDVNIGITKASANNLLTLDKTEIEETPMLAGSGVYSWTQYKDGNTSYVTNGTIKIEVGTLISGYSVNIDGNNFGDGNWYVLGADKGEILLTTASNVAVKELFGQSGATTESSGLNEMVQQYKNEALSDEVRSINVDDINRVTGFDPQTQDSIYGIGETWEYGNHVTYKKISDYIYYSGTKQPENLLPSSYTSFTYWTGSQWKTLSTNESVSISSTYYYYYPDSLKIVDGGEVKGISTSSKPYKLLFESTLEDESNYYWLNSQYVLTHNGRLSTGLRYMNRGFVDGFYLYRSDGTEDTGELGVRPVVYLKDGVIINENDGKLEIIQN